MHARTKTEIPCSGKEKLGWNGGGPCRWTAVKLALDTALNEFKLFQFASVSNEINQTSAESGAG